MTDPIARYVESTIACLEKASKMFDITLNTTNVEIKCDVRGRTAGWARGMLRGKYRLRFNHEAIVKFPESMADVIPHEVAHLVCYARPELGNGHDSGWKRVCRMLGGDDSRTHDMLLTPARPSVRQQYNVCGMVINVGPKQHKKIQDSPTAMYTVNHPKHGRVYIQPHMWTETATVLTPGAKEWKQSDAPVLSKREAAQQIFNNNPGLSRKEMIAKFVSEINMTAAGAATYYQTIKSKA